MNRLLICLVALVLGIAGARAQEDAGLPPIEPVLESMLVNYIRPGYEAFRQAGLDLQASTEALCRDPSAARLEQARSVFRITVEKWGYMEWLRLGPVMDDNRLERVLFFPDRKGTGRRQVQAAIASEDRKVTEASVLAGQSVAVQGLGAREFILFDSGSDALAEGGAAHRCAYAEAVSVNLVNISEEIIDGWQDGTALAAAFRKPGPDNPLYRTDREAVNLLLGQMLHGIEAILDIRMNAFFDKKNPEKDRPRAALFWRSEMTLPSIRSGLEGIEAMFNKSGIEVVAEDLEPRIGAMMRFEFEQVVHTARSLEMPVDAILGNPVTREKLLYLDYAIRTVSGRLGRGFAKARGLPGGFFFGDGD